MITRRSAHQLFAVTSVILAGVIAWHGLAIRHNQQLTQAINAIPESVATVDELNLPERLLTHPAVQLNLGSALANGANLEESERVLNTLINHGDDSSIRIKAQYNLASAYLREALKSGTQPSSQTLPMVELAKQRYRELLFEAPAHWSARYNLERALRMAPEGSDRGEGARVEPVKSVDVIVPGFEKKDLP